MHAAQRLTTFNYYIVISSVITTGMFASSQKDYPLIGASGFLGLVLILLSFIFWKLDLRNRELIGHGEAALKFFEGLARFESDHGEPHPAQVFLREDQITQEKRAKDCFLALRTSHFTYGRCLTAIFLLFGLVGAAGMVFSAVRLWIMLRHP